MILVDTNVLLDIYKADTVWMPWSVRQLRSAKPGQLAINMVVYAELAAYPTEPGQIDKFLDTLSIQVLDLTRPAAREIRPSCHLIFSSALMRKPKNTNYSPAMRGVTKPISPRSN